MLFIVSLLSIFLSACQGLQVSNCSGAAVSSLTWQERDNSSLPWELDVVCSNQVLGNTTTWIHGDFPHCPAGSFVSGLEWSGSSIRALACSSSSHLVIRSQLCTNKVIKVVGNHTFAAADGFVVANLENDHFRQNSLIVKLCRVDILRCVVPLLSNGHVTVYQPIPQYTLSSAYTPVGGVVTVTCNPGYYLRKRVSTATCVADNTWSQPFPACKSCRPIKDCRVSTCTSRGNTVCERCDIRRELLLLGPSQLSCQRPPSVTARLHENGTQVTCSSQGTPPLSLTLVNSTSHVLNSTASNRSSISMVTMVMGAGPWSCVSENLVASDVRSVAMDPPSSVIHNPLPPHFESNTFLLYTERNHTFDCVAGNPTVTWHKYIKSENVSKQLFVTDGRIRVLRNGTLFIIPLLSDAGEYTCRFFYKGVWRYYTLIFVVFDLKTGRFNNGGVKFESELIINWTSSYSAVPGQDLVMSCDVTREDLVPLWVSLEAGQEVGNGTRLVLRNVTKERAGCYICIVRDRHGNQVEAKRTLVSLTDPPETTHPFPTHTTTTSSSSSGTAVISHLVTMFVCICVLISLV